MNRTSKTSASTLLCLAAAGALFWVFQTNTKILNPGGNWFSNQLAFRYQTESFFHGKLALQDHPFFHERDWAWGTGAMHQSWGLGVPLLRFPFEAAAKLFGKTGFPDRLVFVFLYVAVAFFILQFFLSQLTHPWRAGPVIEKIFLTAVVMLFPVFVNLAASRFFVYEETISVLSLWALLIAALLFRLETSFSPARFLTLAFLCGFAPVIRPTGIFYGGVTFALAGRVAATQRGRFTTWLAALLLFSCGPLFVLVTNFFRFGNPWEFGYSLNLSMVYINDFSLRFGYAFKHEPLWPAARELFAALFLNDKFTGSNFYWYNAHPLFSKTIRFREYYLPPYGTTILAICGTCWLMLPFGLSRKEKGQWMMSGFLWSALCFAGLSAFYLRAPAFTSRYAVDFFPAIAVTVAAFLDGALRAADARFKPRAATALKLGLIVLVLAVMAVKLRNDRKTFLSKYKPLPTYSLRDIESRLRQFNGRQTTAADLRLPDRYSCPSNGDNVNIEANFSDWALTSNCLVIPITSVFLNPSRGVEVVFSRKLTVPSSDIAPEILNAIRVRSGLVFLERTSMVKEGDKYRALFCRADGNTPAGPQMVSVGWVPAENLDRDPYIPVFRLYSIEGKNCGQ
jgi:hypothetical protein